MELSIEIIQSGANYIRVENTLDARPSTYAQERLEQTFRDNPSSRSVYVTSVAALTLTVGLAVKCANRSRQLEFPIFANHFMNDDSSRRGILISYLLFFRIEVGRPGCLLRLSFVRWFCGHRARAVGSAYLNTLERRDYRL